MLTRVLGKIPESNFLYRLTGRRELGRRAGQQTHIFSHAGRIFLDTKPIPRTKTTLNQELKRPKKPPRSDLYLLFQEAEATRKRKQQEKPGKIQENETIRERKPSERSRDGSQCSGKEIHSSPPPKYAAKTGFWRKLKR